MKITLNGQSHELSGPTTLTALLESLDLTGKPVVAEHNREAVIPGHYSNTLINVGDVVEIVILAAGG